MTELSRITVVPTVMDGKACIRGLPITVGMILGMMSEGRTRDDILIIHPQLEPEDLNEALAYAAWQLDGRRNEVPRPARIMGLHRGAITMADDFDAPLPDEFWLGTP